MLHLTVHGVEIMGILTHAFWAKTRLLNLLSWINTVKRDQDFYRKIKIFPVKSTFFKEVSKQLISRNFLSVITFYNNFPHYLTVLNKNVVFTRFLPQKLRVIFRNFRTAAVYLFSQSLTVKCDQVSPGNDSQSNKHLQN